ncbi:Obp3 [Eciton burchellii]|nr:Obp3 [Eciton burchellii]
MKRLVFFILTLAAAINADEDIIYMAEQFDSDPVTVQGCLDDAQTTIVELTKMIGKWKDFEDEDELDEESKQLLRKYNSFLACMLEKTHMMQDSKLVIDRIIEVIQNDKNKSNTPSKEFMTECMTTLNEDNDMTREDRASGLVTCFFEEENRR